MKTNEEEKMKRPHVEDHRRIKLEEILKDDYIPFLGGRPKRVKIINNDNIKKASSYL